MRRWVQRVLIALVLLVVLAALAGSRGTYDEFSRPSEAGPNPGRGAPSWAKTCVIAAGPNWLRCARLRGRVIWIQRHDPDGDGDVHLLVACRLKVRVVKISRSAHLHVPGIGSTVTATGPLRRGASVKHELDAATLDG